MANFVSITFDPSRLAAIQQELAAFPDEVKKLCAKAINEAATVGTQAIRAQFLNDLAIDSGDIIKKRVIRRGGNAKPDKLSTQIVIKGKPIGLTSFRYRFDRHDGNGVSVQIMRGRVIRLPHAFVGVGPLGRKHIMESGPTTKKLLLVHYRPNFGRVTRVPKSIKGTDLVTIVEAHPDMMQKPFEIIQAKLASSAAEQLDKILAKGGAKQSGIAGLIHKAAVAVNKV